MRHSRIKKISPMESEAAHHCISRNVNEKWLFDDVAKETLGYASIWSVVGAGMVSRFFMGGSGCLSRMAGASPG
jgi:hypothetical protein